MVRDTISICRRRKTSEMSKTSKSPNSLHGFDDFDVLYGFDAFDEFFVFDESDIDIADRPRYNLTLWLNRGAIVCLKM
jgi:hypothetical protein